MARILLGVTGGIAAYKACELIRLLVVAGHDVLPLPTRRRRALRLVGDALCARAGDAAGRSVSAPPGAELLVVAPLTANTMARLAHGHADDLLTEAALAHDGPVIVAPAMNTQMWAHPATQANLETLRSRGVHVIGPATGELGEGQVGIGRMAEPEEIAAAAMGLLGGASPTRSSLSGRSVVVSAGGTREPLDDVRFLGNRSSGRMGVAVASAARRSGRDCHPPRREPSRACARRRRGRRDGTAAELRREALARVDADVIVMAAAVADYRPAERVDGKRPKDGEPWLVELVPTADVARALGAQKRRGQVLVAFGAELGADGLERKRKMLDDKNADLVVYNDVGLTAPASTASTTR